MSLQTCFDGIIDHRVKGRTDYELNVVLFLVVLSLLSNAKSNRTTAAFIEENLSKLKKQLNLKWKRAPAYTTIRNILNGVSESCLESSFRRYANSMREQKEKISSNKTIKQIAFDGKALCGSADPSIDKRFIQLLSGFMVDDRLILCHYEIDEKSNEIPALQKLIKELGLTSFLITADAMHCQKKHLKLVVKQEIAF